MSSHKKLTEAAIKADIRLTKKLKRSITDISDYLALLLKKGRVEVGYRQSCGYTDPTMHIYHEWAKIIKKAEKLSTNVVTENIKHGNAYATSKGGFWSSKYYIYKSDTQPHNQEG